MPRTMRPIQTRALPLPVRILLTLLLLLLPLAGCGVAPGSPASPAPPVSTYPNLTGNWQIGSAVPVPITAPPSGLVMEGALSNQGTAVTGTFRVFNLGTTFPILCGQSFPVVEAFSGTVDAKGNLALKSADGTISVTLALPATLTTMSTGTISAAGTTCALAIQTAGYGLQVAPVNGTFSGILNAQALPGMPAPSLSGPASLTLTQASMPNPDGQFSLTGTAMFTSTGCMINQAVAGTVSGSTVMLNPVSVTAPPLTIVGGVLNNSQALAVGFDVVSGPCSGSSSLYAYTGTLNKQ